MHDLLYKRIGRVKFFIYSMLLGFISAVIKLNLEFMLQKFGNAILIVGLLVIPIGLIVTQKRVYDIGKSHWWVVLMFIPLVNLFFQLYLLFAKGDEGANQYGTR